MPDDLMPRAATPEGASVPDTMLAFVVDRPTGIQDIRRAAVPVPRPKAGEVLVRIGAVSLNYRDLLVVRGEEGWRPLAQRILCSDGAGTVAAVGEGVNSLRPGDRVVSCFKGDWLSGPLTAANDTPGPGGAALDGVLAEYFVAREHALVPFGDTLSVTEASTLPCAALTAWNAVIEQAPLVPGQRVLLFGTGGVSVFALQFARMAGAEVWAMTRRADRVGALTRLGAHRVIVADSVATMSRQIASEGVLFDLVVDVIGGDLNPQAGVLAPGGRLVAVGLVEGMTASVHHRLMPSRLDSVSVGSRLMFERMLGAIRLHALRPAIDRVFALDEAVEAFRHLDRHRAVGKVVVTVAADRSAD